MRIQSLRFITLASITALALIYSIWWLQMIRSPNERNATDFISFYAVGQVAQTLGLPSIYNVEFQQNVEEAVVGFPLGEGQVLLFIHPPQFVPLLGLIVNDNYTWSFIRWAAILAIVNLTAIYFLTNSLFANEDFKSRLMLVGGSITFFPIFLSVWQGQDTAFLFLGMTLWCVGILKKQDMLAATGLALVTIRPHICIALALPLVFKHKSIFWRFTGIAGILTLLSILAITPKGTVDFINLIKISAEGKWFGIKPEGMMSILGLMIRSMPFLDSNRISIISWVIYGIGLAVIVVLWIRSQEVNERLLGLTVLIATITAPHLHLHDLTLLIFPVLFVIKSGAIKIPQPAFLLTGISFIFIIGMLVDAAYYILPYGMYIALAWVLLRLDKFGPSPYKLSE